MYLLGRKELDGLAPIIIACLLTAASLLIIFDSISPWIQTTNYIVEHKVRKWSDEAGHIVKRINDEEGVDFKYVIQLKNGEKITVKSEDTKPEKNLLFVSQSTYVPSKELVGSSKSDYDYYAKWIEFNLLKIFPNSSVTFHLDKSFKLHAISIKFISSIHFSELNTLNYYSSIVQIAGYATYAGFLMGNELKKEILERERNGNR